MTRTALIIVAAITIITLSSLSAVVITAIVSSVQTAVIVGVVTGQIGTIVASLFGLLQAMYNNTKIDTNTAITKETQGQVTEIHKTIMDKLR